MSSYSQCLSFIRVLRKFMTGIGLIPIKKSLRILQISVIFIVVASVPFMRLWNAEQSLFQSDSELSRIVNISSLLMLWIVHIIILLETSYKINKFNKIILHFGKIRQNLYLACSPHQFDLNAFRIYVFIFFELAELLILAWILHSDGLTWIRWCFSIYSDITLKTKLFEFIFFVILTHNTQRELCFTADKLNVDLSTSAHGAWKKKRYTLQAWSVLGQVRNEIWMVVKMIEELFEYSLVGVLLKMFCDVIFTAYWTYRSFANDSEDFYKTMCLIFLLVRGLVMFACCWICTSCELLDRKFITKLPQSRNVRNDTNLTAIIKDISLDLLHKRIQFSAGDIVTINLQTLGGMAFSAVTFVVILIQFQMERISK